MSLILPEEVDNLFKIFTLYDTVIKIVLDKLY